MSYLYEVLFWHSAYHQSRIVVLVRKNSNVCWCVPLNCKNFTPFLATVSRQPFALNLPEHQTMFTLVYCFKIQHQHSVCTWMARCDGWAATLCFLTGRLSCCSSLCWMSWVAFSEESAREVASSLATCKWTFSLMLWLIVKVQQQRALKSLESSLHALCDQHLGQNC